MPNLQQVDELMEKVNCLVPYFSGKNTIDLSSDVYKFLTGVELLKSITNNADTQTLIKFITLRLSGIAYNKVKKINFGSIDELGAFIKREFLNQRSLETIRSEMTRTGKEPNERVSAFGGRIEVLINEAEELIRKTWSESEAVSALSEYQRYMNEQVHICRKRPLYAKPPRRT